MATPAISAAFVRPLSAASRRGDAKNTKSEAMRWKTLLWVGLSVTAYLMLGGLLFNYLEHQNEATVNVDLQATVKRFLGQYPFVDSQNLSAFLNSVGSFYSNGYRITPNGSVAIPPSKWDYSSAVFFCLTVITTIGYGNLAPSTPTGQSVCCIYALIGIPLLAIFLGGLSSRWKAAQVRLHSCACWKQRGRLAATIIALLYLAVGLGLFFAIPAAIFTNTESWSYSIAIYYCVITLTTIGFGDFVAGQAVQSAVYKFSLFGWIFLGMVFASGLIQAVQVIIEKGSQAVHDTGVAQMRNLEEQITQHMGAVMDKFQTAHDDSIDCECQNHREASADQQQNDDHKAKDKLDIIEQQVIDQHVMDPQVMHQHVVEHQATEHQMTENQVTEHQVTEHQMAEHQVTDVQVKENQVTEHQVTDVQMNEHQVTEHQVTENQVTEHQVTEHQVTEHQVTEHHVTDHQVTDHQVTEHPVPEQHATGQHVTKQQVT